MQYSGNIKVRQIFPSEVPDLWPSIAPMLEAGLAAAKMLPDDFIARLVSGGDVLWGVFDRDGLIACFATELAADHVHLYCLSGRGVHRWARWVDFRMAWYVHDQGRKFYTFYGRPGWRKLVSRAEVVPGAEMGGHVMFKRSIGI